MVLLFLCFLSLFGISFSSLVSIVLVCSCDTCTVIWIMLVSSLFICLAHVVFVFGDFIG